LAGYSWVVLILPDMEETALYQTISQNSDKFSQAAFNTTANKTSTPGKWIGLSTGNLGAHASTAVLNPMICPSFAGDRTIDDSNTPATVYSTVGTLPVGTGGGTHCAMTNYNLCVGTDIRLTTVTGAGTATYQTPMQNGAMQLNATPTISGSYYGTVGSRLAGMTDGTSKTAVAAETKERWYGSWMDGTMNWLVAARLMDPSSCTAISNNSANPGTITYGGPAPAVTGYNQAQSPFDTVQYKGRLVPYPTTGTPNGGSAINIGHNLPDSTTQTPSCIYYLPQNSVTWPAIQAPGRRWGPSSDHGGNIVNHLFGDGHVQQVTDSIDPAVYLWLYTRNGGEPLDSDSVK
jgi:Protein of unknown function (DUF1559)